MQDIIISEIDRHVPDAFDSRIILSGRIGEINAVAAAQLRAGDRVALYHLQARRRLQKHVCRFEKYVLNERGTVVFHFCKAFEKIAIAVVQAHRAIDVRHSQLLIPFPNDV